MAPAEPGPPTGQRPSPALAQPFSWWRCAMAGAKAVGQAPAARPGPATPGCPRCCQPPGRPRPPRCPDVLLQTIQRWLLTETPMLARVSITRARHQSAFPTQDHKFKKAAPPLCMQIHINQIYSKNYTFRTTSPAGTSILLSLTLRHKRSPKKYFLPLFYPHCKTAS